MTPEELGAARAYDKDIRTKRRIKLIATGLKKPRGKTPPGYCKSRFDMTPEELKAAREFDRLRNRRFWDARSEEARLVLRRKYELVRAIRSHNMSVEERERRRALRHHSQRRRMATLKERVGRALRSRIRNTLSGKDKSDNTKAMLGNGYAAALQQRREPWMTDDNFGSAWHLDHVVPCAWFDFAKEAHQKACFHHSNLQPASAFDNRSRAHSVRRKHFDLVISRCPEDHKAVFEEIIWKIRRKDYPERMLRRVQGHV